MFLRSVLSILNKPRIYENSLAIIEIIVHCRLIFSL